MQQLYNTEIDIGNRGIFNALSSLGVLKLIMSNNGNLNGCNVQIKPVTPPIQHCEGPTWDHRTQRLYYVNLNKGEIYSYTPKTNETYSVQLNGYVTPIIPTKDSTGKFIVGINRTITKVIWNGVSDCAQVEELTTVAKEFPGSRFNDGKADHLGRLWLGTMGIETASGVPPNQGSLYLISKDNIDNPKVLLSPVTISNGLAWNTQLGKFYYIDSATFKIEEYNLGDELHCPRVIINVERKIGKNALPDGMTIDVDGNLWVALFGGWSILKVRPSDGEVLQQIKLPVQYVTSVAWGGEKFDVLYVSTSRLHLNSQEIASQPHAGSVFAITGLGTRGFPAFEADF